jgi:prephenate dehydrogenase
MKQWKSVAVIGVGLIGGSIGLALRRRGLCERVVGIGRRRVSLELAEKSGAISSGTTDLAQGVAGAELTVVCTPVGSIPQIVQAVAAHAPRDSLITDVGSTKSSIVRRIEHHMPTESRFIGSHPIAGGERAGPTAANEDLFVGRIVVVTPTTRSCSEDLQALTHFWESLGATVHHMSPEDHDVAVAITSHLPHIAASVLAANTPTHLQHLVGQGWLDCTRVASGSLDVWEPIIAENRGPILDALAKFIDHLQIFRSAVDDNDTQQIHSLLSAGKQRRDALGS